MKETSLHPSLQMRLAALATRISELRQRASQVKGGERIEEFSEVEELERRYKTLDQQLRKLDQEGSGFRQDMKAEIEMVTDDLAGMVEDFFIWIDADFKADHRPKGLSKP